MTKTRTIKRNIKLKSGEGIQIGRHVESLHHTCCTCGQRHYIEVEWRGADIVLRWYVEDQE